MIILKFKLEITDQQQLELPHGIQFLKIAEKDGDLYMWVATTELYASVRTIDIRIIGTGQLIDNEEFELLDYLDTVVMSYGMVWHVFEYCEDIEEEPDLLDQA